MLGELLALAAAFIWSVSVILFKQSEAASPQAMNLFKNVVAVVCLAVSLPFFGGAFAYDGRELALLAGSGILGIALGDTLIFEALRRLGPSLLAVVDLVYAPTLVLLSVLFLGESLSAAFVVGAVLVVAGLVLVTVRRPGAREVPGEGSKLLSGVFIGIAGIVTMGIGVIMAKPVLETKPLVEVTLLRLLAGVIGQVVWIAIIPGQRAAFSILRPSPVWRTLLPASFLGSYVAMLFWLGGFKYADASVAAVLNQLSAVFTIVLARIILGDVLEPRRAMGAAVAFAGALVVLVFN